MTITILAVDDCEILRAGMKVLFDKHDDLEMIGEGNNGLEAVQKAKEFKPDVIIMDINLPQMDGIEATRQIISTGSKSHIIALSAYFNESLILDMLEAGVTGYVTKDCLSDELVHAVRSVHEGHRYLCEKATSILVEKVAKSKLPQEGTNPIRSLTDKECQMVKMVASGLSSKQIAYELGISVKTVDGRRRRVREKLHLNGVADLVRFAIKKHMVKLDENEETNTGKLEISQ